MKQLSWSKKPRRVPSRRGYPTEGPIQTAIIQFLRLHGFWVWRQNNHAVYDAKRGVYRRNPSAMLGVPDIMGTMPDGRILAIEVKSRTGKPTPEQGRFIAEVRRRGGVAFVARTLEDVKRELGL